MHICRLETADFEKNDLYVVQYKHIKEKLQDRYVQVILANKMFIEISHCVIKVMCEWM